jgi:hypothetical protein
VSDAIAQWSCWGEDFANVQVLVVHMQNDALDATVGQDEGEAYRVGESGINRSYQATVNSRKSNGSILSVITGSSGYD